MAAIVRARNMSIDAFRVVANVVIILVHTRPLMGPGFGGDTRLCGELINQFVRIATPFFFMASGYFFAASLSRGAEALAHAQRLIARLTLFFLFWSLVYICIPLEFWLKAPSVTYTEAVRAALLRAASPKFLLTGARVHLWFLPAMACALALLAAAVRVRRERALVVGALILYVVGLLAGAYKLTPIGFDLGFGTRNGPFLSTIFVASGFWLHRLRLELSTRQALTLIAVGTLMRCTEVYWITMHAPTQPSQMEYLMGTYPFAVGVFFLLLSSERLGKVRWMLWLSRYSPGIYCAHMMFVDYFNLRPLAVGNILWEIVRPVLILSLTVAVVLAMGKIPRLKAVVT